MQAQGLGTPALYHVGTQRDLKRQEVRVDPQKPREERKKLSGDPGQHLGAVSLVFANSVS